MMRSVGTVIQPVCIGNSDALTLILLAAFQFAGYRFRKGVAGVCSPDFSPRVPGALLVIQYIL